MSDKAQLQQQVRAAARKLVPVLRERADACEQARQLPAETIRDFAEAGFFRILQPKKWGGYELDPHDFYDVQMTVAEGCMSSAWCLGVIAIHNWQLALFNDRAAQDVWGEDDSVLISSSYMPVGKVEHVDGGLKLSGQWGFSSGSDHCDWVFLGAMVPPKDGDSAGGPPDMRTFLVPRSDYEIVDDWHVMGLKGTGSKTIVVKDAFVPEYRTHKAMDGFTCNSPGNAVNTAPLFKIPFGQMFVRAVSTAAIGALKGACDNFIEKTAKRVGKNDGKSAGEDPHARYALAQADSIVDELKLVLFRNFDRLLEAAEGGPELTMEERIKFRWESAAVPQRCIEGIDPLFAFAGGSGIYQGNALMRTFVDIHASRAHTANNPQKFGGNWGAVQLGAENGDFFL